MRVAAAAASGLLLALSRPNFDYSWLALIGLVPLFVAWRDRGGRASAGLAFVAGAVYYGIVCSWTWFFGAVAIIPLVSLLAGVWAFIGAGIGWLRVRGVTNPWLVAAMWVIGDTAIGRFPFGGFSWGELGYAFAAPVPARAVASVGGVALVTYLVVVVNALLADLVVAARRCAVRRIVWGELGVAVIALAIVGATVTHATPRVEDGLRVALIQGNDKNRDLTAEEEADRYLPKSHFALADQITGPVDLIVFPESSMDADPRTDPYIRDSLAEIAIEHDAWVLANSSEVDADPDGNKALNLNVLFSPEGEIVGEYAKRHLVPFGEVVPFRSVVESLVPAVKEQIPRDFAEGTTSGLFDLGDTKIASVICFESAFGPQIRPLVADGAEVIVVSTNNRSYRRSANSAQHLAIGQMRTAETGRPLVQASISGISAVIDVDGVVHDRTKLFENGVVETTVGTVTGQTPYVKYGDWVVGVCALIVLTGFGVAFVRRGQNRSVESRAPQETVSIASRIAGYDLMAPAPPEAEPVDVSPGAGPGPED
jgi:apolipoprotein N-acyltransferase